MKYLFLSLTVALPAAWVIAQNIPQGPSPLVIDAYESVTNTVPADRQTPQKPSPMTVRAPGAGDDTAPPTGFNLQPQPLEALPLITGAYGIPTNTVPQAETAEPTNQVNFARISFLMNTGMQYVNEGEFQEAERAYLRALETDPGNPNIRFSLSTLYIQMERYKEAVDILTSMAADFPENALVHNNLAWIYSTGGAMKNGKLAVRHAREAILTAPIEASMWNTLAEAYYVTGQYDKALRASDYAVDLLRMQNAAEEEIAKFEMQRAKIQRAEEAAKMLLNLDGSE